MRNFSLLLPIADTPLSINDGDIETLKRTARREGTSIRRYTARILKRHCQDINELEEKVKQYHG